MLGLYLHVPFCSAICNYCNFNRGLFDAALKARYVDALIAECGSRTADAADTIYFGGGTPSLLEPDEIASLIAACRAAFGVAVDAAIALAPDHLSLYLLELYPNAPLKDDMARARWSQAPDEDAEAMYLTAMERLEAAGLTQYEISNVARKDRQSRHNLKYWTDG